MNVLVVKVPLEVNVPRNVEESGPGLTELFQDPGTNVSVKVAVPDVKVLVVDLADGDGWEFRVPR